MLSPLILPEEKIEHQAYDRKMKLANRTHKRKQKHPEPADPRNMTSIQQELNAFTSNKI